MRWLLAGLAIACGVGLLWLARATTSQDARDVPDRPAPQPRRPGTPSPRTPLAVPAPPADAAPAPVEPPPATAAALDPADQAIFERIETVDAPRELRRLAIECQSDGRALDGGVLLSVTLVTGGGQARVDELAMKHSLEDAALKDCVKQRLRSARWTQDAPARRWQFTVALPFRD